MGFGTSDSGKITCGRDTALGFERYVDIPQVESGRRSSS